MKPRQRRGTRIVSANPAHRVKGTRGFRPVFRALMLLVVAGALVFGVLACAIVRRGLSTRTEPSHVEEVVARSMRSLATPSAIRGQMNPVPRIDEVITDGLAHYADHCAVCHANDGSGTTPIGRGLYPRAPDMRLDATQSLSDGQLFSIIENGIRLTGMPAWGDGTPEGEQASWGLVHFIRHLPHLTPEEIEQMEALNPKTAGEFREAEEIRRFLEGQDGAPTPDAPHKTHHE